MDADLLICRLCGRNLQFRAELSTRSHRVCLNCQRRVDERWSDIRERGVHITGPPRVHVHGLGRCIPVRLTGPITTTGAL